MVDIGPNTINEFQKIIGKSGTVFWVGPAGITENKDTAKVIHFLLLIV